MLGGAAAAISPLLPQSAEASSDSPEYQTSPLTLTELETLKLDSADKLIEGFWDKKDENGKNVRDFYLKHHFPKARNKADVRESLRKSARIEIPTPEMCKRVREQSKYRDGDTMRNALDDIVRDIPEGKYGHYEHGDTQRHFVIKKTGPNTGQFIVAITLSTSADGYSNTLNSGGTPVGKHRVGKGKDISKEGILAEDVSYLNSHRNVFEVIQLEGETKPRTITKSMNGKDALPELTTARLLAISRTTQPGRAANVHGTNFENELGKRASGGCARVSNVAIKFLFGADKDGVPYVEDGTIVVNEDTNRWEIQGGTPLMVFATEASALMAQLNADERVEQEWLRKKETAKSTPQKIPPPAKVPDAPVVSPPERKAPEKKSPEKNEKKKNDGYWEDVTGKI